MSNLTQVRISWLDSRSSDGWTMRSELEMKLAEITTIGFLVEETEDLVCVAASAFGDDQFNGIILIPKLCVSPAAKRFKILEAVTLFRRNSNARRN